MKEYYGNYLGLCLNNNDPEKRGRVQVFIPHILPNLYKDWNEAEEDIKILCVGNNIPDSLNGKTVEKLMTILPWAESASPVMGSSSPGDLVNNNQYVQSPTPLLNEDVTDKPFNYTGETGNPIFNDGISAEGLQPFVQERLGAFAGQFPNAVITSTSREGTGSNHNTGRAMDIRTTGVDEATVQEYIKWWSTAGGATEIGYELNKPGQPHLHVGFRTDGKRTAFNVGEAPQWWNEFAGTFRASSDAPTYLRHSTSGHLAAASPHQNENPVGTSKQSNQGGIANPTVQGGDQFQTVGNAEDSTPLQEILPTSSGSSGTQKLDSSAGVKALLAAIGAGESGFNKNEAN